MALEDARSEGVGYLRCGVRSLIRGGKVGSIFEAGAGFHRTVDENRRGGRARGKRWNHQTGSE